MLIYKEPIKTFYKDSDIKYDIDTKELNEALINYNNKEISGEDFLQIYDLFINNFDMFSKVMNKKQLGAMGTNQKELLNYGKNFKKLSKNLSIPQDQD